MRNSGLAEEEERKKMMDKKSTIQNWVNNIAEENESEVSSGSSISKPPIQTKKTQRGPNGSTTSAKSSSTKSKTKVYYFGQEN